MLRPMPIEPIPPETARVARAAFRKGNRYLRVADALSGASDKLMYNRWHHTWEVPHANQYPTP
jgi:hypothetical protein